MNIGNVTINGKLCLAPMAGTCDRAFRALCVRYGAAYVVGEMTSSKGICMNDRKSKELLRLSDTERPAAVQIFGDDPVIMAEAAVKCMDYRPESIDINMGCPAPKVAANGGGSALMKRPQLAEEIIKSVVNAVPVPVTVKIRAGWDSDHLNAVEMAQRAEQAGAAAVAVHGRTRVQMYAGHVDYAIIKAVKEAVSIPVIGNGDIVDEASAAKMFEQTNCDLLMIGRGALGRPWLFQQINAYLAHGQLIPEPSVAKRMAVMAEHIRQICTYKGENIGMKEARKHAAWYTRGMRDSASFRRKIGQLSTLEELEELRCQIIQANEEVSG